MSGERSKACIRVLRQHWLQMRCQRIGTARNVALAAAPVLLTLLVYLGYGEHQRRTLPGTVNALVLDASLRLQDALQDEANDASALGAQRLDDHYAAVEQNLAKLRAMETSAIEDLARVADDYLLTTREILRRRAADYRNRMQVTESMRALRAHMLSDNRTGVWITQAVRKKERLEAEFRQYRLTSEALAGLLGQYAASRARLAARVAPAQLTDENVALGARNRTLETFSNLTDEVEKAGQLNAYR